MKAEQETTGGNKMVRARRMENCALQARNDIKRFKAEMNNMVVSAELQVVKAKYGTYLDTWDNCFYYMARYGASGNVEDLGTATRFYKAVGSGFREIGGLLHGEPRRDWPLTRTGTPPQQGQPLQQGMQVIREKEIIREKEVIIKIRCPYCRGTFDETLDACPNCGARRQ